MNILVIIIPTIIFLLGAIYFFLMNPIKTGKAKVLKKSGAKIGKLWEITVEMNGKTVVLYTKYFIYSRILEGDTGTIWYRDNFCLRFFKNK